MKQYEKCLAYNNGYCDGISLRTTDKKIKCEDIPYEFLCQCYEEDKTKYINYLDIIYDKMYELSKLWDDESRYCSNLGTKEGQIKAEIYKTCSEYLMNYMEDICNEFNN